jgi:cholesterol transport system auxiliary component
MRTPRSPKPRLLAVCLFAAGALSQSGCALMSKGAVVSPRYFSPEVAFAPTSESTRASASGTLELRLGQVEAASHLEERMAYRITASELGYYEDRRWTEEPYEYLRRALERELFERKHVHRVVTGAANPLDVELTAFEELRLPTPHVRLALTYTLHDDRESFVEQSIVVERPLPAGSEADRAERVAGALGEALAEAVSQVSDAVTETLRTPAIVPCAAPEPARVVVSSSHAATGSENTTRAP